MNILYISNEYPPETGYGGIGTYTKHSAEGMASLGHTVHVICRLESGNPSSTTVNGVIVHRVSPGTYPLPPHPLFYPLRTWCYRRVPHSLQRLAWAKEAFAIYTKRLLPAIRFDIIEYPECGGEGYYFSRLRGTIRVARLHTPWEIVRSLDNITESVYDRMALSCIERSTVRRSSAVTSPTRALAKMLESRWRLRNIKIIPNPLPVSMYAVASGNDWIYTGRIEYRKGVHILIKAYASLMKTYSPPRLRLIGVPYGRHPDGSEYSEHISSLITRLQCDQRIEWIRGVPGSSIPEYLRQCAVAVFPSSWENQSYSCLEAMASGLAVVASRAGGYPEMITENENGLLFEPGNAEALAGQLSRLIDGPRLRLELGTRARLTAAGLFDTPVVCRDMETLYRSIKEGMAP
jgi:glycosyltransferase involved in cell wall biosynthesis